MFSEMLVGPLNTVLTNVLLDRSVLKVGGVPVQRGGGPALSLPPRDGDFQARRVPEVKIWECVCTSRPDVRRIKVVGPTL